MDGARETIKHFAAPQKSQKLKSFQLKLGDCLAIILKCFTDCQKEIKVATKLGLSI